MDDSISGQEIHTPRLPPELLWFIMEQVDCSDSYQAAKRSLFSATLVNHEWAEAGTDILWRNPPAPALAFVSPKRRQYYANKICELYFEGKEGSSHHSTFRDLTFPRLKTVLIDHVKLEEGEELSIKQYMQPQLQNFFYWGGWKSEGALNSLETNCPRLEEISLQEPIDSSDQDRITLYFKNCKTLQVVDLGDGWDNLIPVGLFTVLADHENIEKIKIRSFLEDSIIRDSLRLASNPFRSLQSLQLNVDSESVTRLVSVAGSIHTLFLTIQDSEYDVLAPIGSMTNLVHLELTYLTETDLSRQGFRALGNLQKLQVISIEPKAELVTATWLDDADFIDITSKLKKLSNFVFKVECGITLSSLTSLGTTHRRLVACDVFGIFELDEWTQITTPLFPHLARFGVDAPSLRGQTTG